MIADEEYTCPRCNSTLEEVRTSKGIFWGCNGCGGRAISVELLRRIFTPESINPLWLHAISGVGHTGRACPVCHRPMFEVKLSDTAEINVDVCKLCHFVWFDAGETEGLVPRPSPTQPPPMPQKAREAIALMKVEELARQAEGSDFDSEPPDDWWKNIAGFFGMPVEYDATTSEGRPWLTWLITAAMVGASVLAFPHLQEVVNRYGLIPAQAMRLGGLTFITSFFLHGGVVHLVGNSYFLLVFGDNVESAFGRIRYLFLLAFSAFVGDLAHIAADPHSNTPCIGASGGIAGVITFYAFAFPRARLGFLLWRWWHWIRMPAWFALVLWILFQLLGAYEQLAGLTSVSAFAHLGGAAVGVVAWVVWRGQGKAAIEPQQS